VAPGYYWVRHEADGSRFIALLEGRQWFMCAIGYPIQFEVIQQSQIICRVQEPLN
jgi:hypothetical protein